MKNYQAVSLCYQPQASISVDDTNFNLGLIILHIMLNLIQRLVTFAFMSKIVEQSKLTK
jgi:hypothetical protein